MPRIQEGASKHLATDIPEVDVSFIQIIIPAIGVEVPLEVLQVDGGSEREELHFCV